MEYEYEKRIRSSVELELFRDGRHFLEYDAEVIKELKEVYAKAKALDKVITIVEDKEEFYSNEFIEAVVSAVDEFIDYELEDK